MTDAEGYVIGLSSWGPSSYNVDLADVSVQVDNFLGWIEENSK